MALYRSDKSIGSPDPRQLKPPPPKHGNKEMNTAFLLMAQYNGKAVIPVKDVCADYFTHLTVEIFLRKVGKGEIKIPITRMETSNKAAKGIHLQDLANYLDARRAEGERELSQMHRA